MSISLAKPRWSEAKSRADALTAQFSAPPIPAIEIAERNGVDVVFVDFGKFSREVSGFCDFAEGRLFVNQDDGRERQTFTIAHELGHWILHKSKFIAEPDKYAVLPRFGDPDKDDPLEKEANHFAANLLVPVRLLTPVKHLPASKLADLFAVSRSMMEFRLKNV